MQHKTHQSLNTLLNPSQLWEDVPQACHSNHTVGWPNLDEWVAVEYIKFGLATVLQVTVRLGQVPVNLTFWVKFKLLTFKPYLQGTRFFFQGGFSQWWLGGQAKIQYCVTSFPWWSSICASEHSMVAGPYLRQRYQSRGSLLLPLLMELAESTSCRTISVDPVIICLYISILCCYILAYNAISQ